MTTSTLVLRLAGAALAVVSAAMLVTGFAGLGPPMGLENWGLMLAVVFGCGAAILFIHADGPGTTQPGA